MSKIFNNFLTYPVQVNSKCYPEYDKNAVPVYLLRAVADCNTAFLYSG